MAARCPAQWRPPWLSAPAQSSCADLGRHRGEKGGQGQRPTLCPGTRRHSQAMRTKAFWLLVVPEELQATHWHQYSSSPKIFSTCWRVTSMRTSITGSPGTGEWHIILACRELSPWPQPHASPAKSGTSGFPGVGLAPSLLLALTSAAVGAVLRNVVTLVHPLAIALEVDLGGRGGTAGQAHCLVLHNVDILRLQLEVRQQVRGCARCRVGHGRALLSTCGEMGLGHLQRALAGPLPSPAQPHASGPVPPHCPLHQQCGSPLPPCHPSGKAATQWLSPLNPCRSLMSTLSTNEKEM